jgi:hypothetical protein
MANYSNAGDVRRAAGNILNTEFADADFTEEMDAADSWINTRTHKSDWDSGDIQYYLIVRIAKKKSVEFILEQYGVEFESKVKDLREQAEGLIKDVVDNIPPDDTTGLDTLILLDESNYQSYPLSLIDDPESGPYISTEVNYTI